MALNSEDVVSPSAFSKQAVKRAADRNPVSNALYREALSTNGRFFRKIHSLENDLRDLRLLFSNRIRKYRDVVGRLEKAGNVIWCPACDTVCKTGESCSCSAHGRNPL